MQNLFVYGTLQYPEILKKITGKSFVSKPAILYNFNRHKVQNAEYPAIVSKHGAKTYGLVLENVDDESLKAIDIYEGEEYEKSLVSVFTEDSKTEAFTYIWIAGNNYLEEEDWDKALFEAKYLELYIGTKS